MTLLDTHALVWLVAEPQRLSHAAATSIRRTHGTAHNDNRMHGANAMRLPSRQEVELTPSFKISMNAR
jgi:hypothetical protein